VRHNGQLHAAATRLGHVYGSEVQLVVQDIEYQGGRGLRKRAFCFVGGASGKQRGKLATRPGDDVVEDDDLDGVTYVPTLQPLSPSRKNWGGRIDVRRKRGRKRRSR
jgi:hypothetical protein